MSKQKFTSRVDSGEQTKVYESSRNLRVKVYESSRKLRVESRVELTAAEANGRADAADEGDDGGAGGADGRGSA